MIWNKPSYAQNKATKEDTLRFLNANYKKKVDSIQTIRNSNSEKLSTSDSGLSIKTDSLLVSDSLVSDSMVRNNAIMDSLKKDNEIKTTIFYTSKDSIFLEIPNKKMYIYKEGDVKYDNITLKADYIVVDWTTNALNSKGLVNAKGDTTGNPVFTEDNEKYLSSNIGYDFKTRHGAIANVQTQYGESYIHGKIVNKSEKPELYIGETKYTTCNLEKPHYYIYSKKAKLIQNDKIVTGPFYLAVADVPTPLGFIFGIFPSKKGRSSGILVPTYGETKEMGFFLENGGYYFAMGDNVDLAARGNIYTKGAWGLHLRSTYAKRYKRNGNLVFTFNNRPSGEYETKEFTRNRDYLFQWMHFKVPKRGKSFSASVNYGSTSFYRNSLNNTQDIFNNNLSSNISFTKAFLGTPISTSLNLGHNQNNQTEVVNFEIPNFGLNMGRIFPFKKSVNEGKEKWYEKVGVSYGFNARNTLSAKESRLKYVNRKALLDTMLNGAQHSVPLSTSFRIMKYFTLSPNFTYTEKWSTVSKRYYLDANQKVRDTVQKGFSRYGTYTTGAGFSTNLYGFIPININRMQSIRHKLTPTISFTYIPDFSDKKWGYYEYFKDTTNKKTGERGYSKYNNYLFGGPGSGKVQSIGFSLSNNFQMKVKEKEDTSKKFKKINLLESLNLSGNYNLAADSLNLSKINISARTTLFERLGIDVSSTYDPYIVDTITKVNLNRFEWKENHKLARLDNATISLSLNLRHEKKIKNSEIQKTEEGKEKVKEYEYDYSEGYVDYSLPFDFSIGYIRNYQFVVNDTPIITQSVNISSNIRLTEKWKVGGSTGYDFTNEDFTFTNINIYRDLHCWEMKFNWVPFGARQSYRIDINVKAAILQDLKLTRRRDWFER